MNTRGAVIGVVVVIMCVGCAARGTTRMTVHPAVDDFNGRVEQYMKVNHQLAAGIPQVKQSADAGANQDSSDILAGRIQSSRSGAKQGDIFTPAITSRFRELLNPVLRGAAGADARATIRDDAPKTFTLHVNDRYPSGASFPTVPVSVLAVLPVLPDGLEYRIVDRHLLLRDVRANVIVDYMFDVMCATC